MGLMSKSSRVNTLKSTDQYIADPGDGSHMSVAEARRIMGGASDSMSNDEIEKAIYDLTAIARSYIKSVLKVV